MKIVTGNTTVKKKQYTSYYITVFPFDRECNELSINRMLVCPDIIYTADEVY